jgi:hypothetical protein
MPHPVHRPRALPAAAGLVVALVVALGASGCRPPAPTELTVAYRSTRSAAPITYTVRCGPDRAEISPAVPGLTPEGACRVALAQRRFLVDGPDRGRICLQAIYGWELATVTGHVDDEPVDRPMSRANSCADADWRRLVGLLPAPSGSR